VDFALTQDQQNIRDAVLKHSAQFTYDYWRARDREARLYTVAPISTNLILSYLAEHVLGLPRRY
jgi:hypothetical protein